ncbi:threonine aldolase family protein [Reinekea marinisedimentorum]|uniref:L-threonine aldolase n=1 Tax=Reinekea marinisedimentorum TaxID=230495 RepID=A0A4R3I2H1_9GAMM|nr:low specificity L-threonine aldolase [Reinekea marinisedimentorum]TCS39772.1 L-threonine aldolase [Reinekea marinisedimentorum]
MYFGSDNQAGASDKVMAGLMAANSGVSAAYGDDEWTAKATKQIQQMFDCDAEVFLVSTGTAANCLALSCMASPWQTILCHGQAHIINDELTAPEFFTQGARLVGLDSELPKLTAASLEKHLSFGAAHPPHNAEPGVLSLTQLSEAGQLYSIEELNQLTSIAHEHGLYVHMDGARFANAVAALGCHPSEISWKAGVDVLCLGATKNGALCAEAVVFFNKELAKNFVAQRKRAGHLISKSRWLGAQFCSWLDDEHWLALAKHANSMAAQLSAELSQLSFMREVWPVAGNELFMIMPKQAIEFVRERGAIFYEWPQNLLPAHIEVAEGEDAVRFVTSFRTTGDEVSGFVGALKEFSTCQHCSIST